MKKILYIIANSKTEEKSASRTVSKMLVNALIEKLPSVQLEEVNLYKDHIPQLKGCYFNGKSAIISTDAREQLSAEEQREVEAIDRLCEQFRSADIYVLAAPMWSLSFPAPVKEYLDCVVQTGKTISFENKRPQGLLGDKQRVFIYVQSSGGKIPFLLKPVLSKGSCYVHTIAKSLGISAFRTFKVDNTGKTEEERNMAVQQAIKRIPAFINRLHL